MSTKQNPSPLKKFTFEGKEEPISFVEKIHVADGVECDVYTFDKDSNKDLGVIRISQGKKTPLQKVLKGDRTIEGYISGKGKLVITKPDGKKDLYVAGKEPLSVDVKIGELMQWQADKDSNLVAYEICYPSYQDGRYENIKYV